MVFLFDGNLLCLDFLNTRIVREGEPVDLLGGPDALMEWLRAAAREHPLDLGRARRPEEGAAPDAPALFDAGLELRDAIAAIADAALEGTTPPLAAIAAVNEASRRSPLLVSARNAGGRWVEAREAAAPGAWAALGDVARSAIHLLVDLDPARVGRCAHAECVLYFYDTTRNRSRRWCSMERCGNRSKVARHYRRQRAEG